VRPRPSDERGFTLVELLMAMTIGVLILFGAFAVLDLAVRSQRDIDDRSDAVARGRLAMEEVTRQLRAQVCLGRDVVPIQSATDTAVTFYASLARDPRTVATSDPGDTDPLLFQQRTLEFVPSIADPAVGRIDETVIDNAGSMTNPVFPPGGARRRTLVDRVRLANGRLFRYFKFDPTLSPQMTELTTRPVPAAERALTVQVQVAFEALPSRATGTNSRLKTVYDSKVYVRTADPTDPERSPKCL
jgi:prepilin-type N-terminal cleavage/methylation domain-containing protein